MDRDQVIPGVAVSLPLEERVGEDRGAAMVDDARDARDGGYRRAQLWVEELALVVRPAQLGIHGDFPFDVEPVHVLTAHNPGPARPGPGPNAARQESLVGELRARGLRLWHAVAGAADRSHEEDSVIVAGLSDDEARTVGAAWGQDAVFRWDRHTWTVLACDDAPPITQGWETGDG